MVAVRRNRFNIDPGTATVVAAGLALAGTVVTVVASRDPGSPGGASTVTSPVTTTTTPATTTSTTNPAGPVVQLPGSLREDQRRVVEQAAAGLLTAARSLPLVVEGGFDARNAPGWSVGKNTYEGGIVCAQGIAGGRWNLTVTSVAGGAYCNGGVTQEAADLVATMGTRLATPANADISLYVRASADLSRAYQIGFNPQTQQFWETVVVGGSRTQLIAPTYTGAIRKNAPNTLTVLALGSSQTIFVNDLVVALVSQETRVLAGGQTRIQVTLNEANSTETLSVDRFEVYGRAGTATPS